MFAQPLERASTRNVVKASRGNLLRLGKSFGLVGFVVALATIVLSIVIYYRIAAKAGYNGWVSLLLFVPLVNIVMIFIFAFSTWPIERRLAYLEQVAAQQQHQPPYPPLPPQGQSQSLV